MKLSAVSQLTWHRLTMLVIAGGVLGRLKEFLDNRSLWFDEAVVANQLLSLDLGQILTLKEHNLGYPFGFLAVMKSFVSVMGGSEYVLRLFPLVCGVVALALFPWAVRRMFSPAVVLLGTCLFAFSPELIYYSGEAKPYSTDVLVAVFNIGLLERLTRDTTERKKVILYTGVGLLSLAFSLRGFCVLLSGSIGLMIYHMIARERGRAQRFLGVAVAGGILLGLDYVLLLNRFVQISPRDIWEPAYRFPPTDVRLLWRWIVISFPWHLLKNLAYPVPLAFVCYLTGILSLWLRDRRHAVILIAPVVMILIAALCDYPLLSRLILFLFPIVMLCIAEGLAFCGRLSRGPVTWTATVLATGLVGLFSFYVAMVMVANPYGPQELKPVLAGLSKEYRANDFIFLNKRAGPAWRYYAPRFDLNGTIGQADDMGRELHEVIPENYLKAATYERLWVVSPDMDAAEVESVTAIVKEYGGRRSKEIAVIPAYYASTLGGEARALLFELRSGDTNRNPN